MAEPATALRVCPLCEATCGLRLSIDGARVRRVEGDPHDVFSHGYLCPKGVAVADLHHDPDRLRAPLVKDAAGRQVEVSWPEAFAAVDERFTRVVAAHGRQSVGVYAGNPNVHTLAGQLALPAVIKALGTRSVFTASTMDQMPKHVSAGLMFGDKLSIPVPDIDRTDFLLVLGADPLSSNGSLWTVADLPGRLRALLARGGRLVVVDPRRTRTAARASRHHFIRPGTDAFLLFALVHALAEEGLIAPGALAAHLAGVEEVTAAAKAFPPELVADRCGIPAAEIRDLARALAAAERACVYGRIGTHTARFGTLAAWLVDVLNALTGNLDQPGGAMFPLAPAGQRNSANHDVRGKALRFGRFTTRVRGLPEVFGELPVACLAEEIDTPGDGQLRALVTVAGNPALSAPDGARVERALAGLELLVSVDPYRNETTRLADVVLPPPSPLQRGHYDLAFTQLAVRNTARYSPPAIPLDADQPSEWDILLRLGAIFGGQPDAAIADVDDFVALTVMQRETARSGSPVAGRDPEELLRALAPRRAGERVLDFLLRVGPYGEGFGADPDGLTLARLEAQPHGVDLGPLQPRLPALLSTPSGKVELAPEHILADVPALEAALDEAPGGVVLIGRRHLRSNNSWMHNLPTLAGGTNRCVLQVNPTDAAAHGLVDGGRARVRSDTGLLTVDVEVTDDLMPGVVSLPHGWGHDRPGAALEVAAQRPGVNSNVLTDPSVIDPLSGNAVLNAIPVTLAPASP